MTVRGLLRILQRVWEDIENGEVFNVELLRALAWPVLAMTSIFAAERLLHSLWPAGRGLSYLYFVPMLLAARSGNRLAGVATALVLALYLGICYPAERPLLGFFVNFVLLAIATLLFVAYEQRYAKTIKQATTDSLTGLLNRRAFYSRARQKLAQAARDRQEACVVLFDCDKFKQINDLHGHPAGDQALAIVARTLEACAQEIDVVARLGGDEFAVLLAETDHIGANMFLGHVRRVLEQESASLPYDLRVSAGIAHLRQDARNLEGLLAAADQKMFRQKNASRLIAESSLNSRNRPRLN